MDARILCVPMLLAASTVSLAAGYRTQHFLVTAPTPQLARQVGDEAERLRHDLAMQWTGRPIGPWEGPCYIDVYTGPNMPARGETKYIPIPEQRKVIDFRMKIWGSQQRLLDSVLPHEISHTVLATHFGRPLPRWADEGACTTVEDSSERMQHERLLREFLMQNRGISLNKLFMMKEYPADILPLYAQGYSMSCFLIAQGGRRKFVEFLEDYFRRIDRDPMPKAQWTEAVQTHYSYDSLSALQDAWLGWVKAGSGSVEQFAAAPAAETTPTRVASTDGNESIRTASADSDSWYARRRQQTAAREQTSSSKASTAATQSMWR